MHCVLYIHPLKTYQHKTCYRCGLWRKHMTTSPCVLKNALVFISSVARLIPCSKGLGHLLLLLLFFLLSYCFLYQKPLKSYLSVLAVCPCPKSLINTFRSSLGSILLLIKNAAIDPLRLWVIS